MILEKILKGITLLGLCGATLLFVAAMDKQMYDVGAATFLVWLSLFVSAMNRY